MDKIYVCVGSLNPTKFNATKLAFSRYYSNFKMYNIKAESKVSNQPIGLKNIIDGAVNRAFGSLDFIINEKKKYYHIFGVGIEAGLAEIPYTKTKFMDFQFCAITDETRKISLGSGIAFEYPKFVVDQILKDQKKEIGEIIGKLADNENLKNEAGAISFFSKNVIKRTEILTYAVICALLPFINVELYSTKEAKKNVNI